MVRIIKAGQKVLARKRVLLGLKYNYLIVAIYTYQFFAKKVRDIRDSYSYV